MVIVIDAGIHGDHPMGGGQWARLELIRHMRNLVPAHYCFITYRESILSQLAREIYQEVKIVDYAFIRQRRHHISLDPRSLLSLLGLLRKAAVNLQAAIDEVQESVRPRRLVIMPNENYSRVVFALLQLLGRRRYPSVTIIDNEFTRGVVDRLLVFLYGIVFSRLCAASLAAGRPFEGLASKKLRVIYPGVDIQFIRQQADRLTWQLPSGEKGGRLNILFSGVFLDIKRPDFAVEVMARFLKAAPDAATLHLCGDGPLAERVRNLARELHLTVGQDIIFWGYLERNQFLRRLAEADILLHPSTTESFGRVVVEAQALGVPVIVSQAGALPEVVVDGDTGFVVPPADLAGFVQKLRLLAENAALRTRMSQRAYAYAERFDVKAALKAYTRIFQELLRS